MPVATLNPAARPNLFEKYGGFSSVRLAVMDFYERALDSDVVGHHFEDIDMARLIDHQTMFISQLLGGPGAANDGRLERAHANLGVTNAEFDEVVLILGETLNAAGFEIEDLKQVCGAVEARRRLIVQGERAPCM